MEMKILLMQRIINMDDKITPPVKKQETYAYPENSNPIKQSKKFNDQIKDFGHKLAMHIAASNPLTIEVSQLDKKMLEKENEIISEELKNSGKDANIVEKISIGKLEKFKQENTLINQIWIMDPKKKVKDVIAELGNENSITIKDFVRYKVGE